MRRLLLIPLTVALLALTPAMAGSLRRAAPPGFIGISPQGATDADDYELMREAGITSRAPADELGRNRCPRPATASRPAGKSSTSRSHYAAENGMRPFLFVWGTPEWVSPRLGGEPVATARQRQAWLQFLHAAVSRYGPQRQLLARTSRPAAAAGAPVGDLERGEHRHLLQGTGPGALRPADPHLRPPAPPRGAGLDGDPRRPLRPPPADPAEHPVRRLPRRSSTGCRGSSATSTASRCTPTSPTPARCEGEIENLRRVMSFNGDAATPLYVTEMGWGSDGFESRWERGPRGQARELDRSFAMLTGNRRRWHIGGVWWFSWTDQAGSCQFCDSAGLLTSQPRSEALLVPLQRLDRRRRRARCPVPPPGRCAARPEPRLPSVRLAVRYGLMSGASYVLFGTTALGRPMAWIDISAVAAALAASAPGWWSSCCCGGARSQRRFEILGEVATVSEAAGSLEETFEAICDILVPEIADFCMIDVIEDGEPSRVAVRVAPGGGAAAEQGLREREPSLPERMVERRGRLAGTALLRADVGERPARARPRRRTDLEFLRSLGMRSAITLALQARGQVKGTLTLGVAWSGRRYRSDDVRFRLDPLRPGRPDARQQRALRRSRAGRSGTGRDRRNAAARPDAAAAAAHPGLVAGGDVPAGGGRERSRRRLLRRLPRSPTAGCW